MMRIEYEGRVIHNLMDTCETCGEDMTVTVTEDELGCIREYHHCRTCDYDVLANLSEPVVDVCRAMEVA